MILGGLGRFGWLVGGCGQFSMCRLDSSLNVFLGELLACRVSFLATQANKTKNSNNNSGSGGH